MPRPGDTHMHRSPVTGGADSIVRLRHPGRAVSGVLVVLLLAWTGSSIVSTGNIEFSVIPQFLFDPVVLSGVQLTIFLTVVAMALGLLIGVLAAVCRLSENPVLSWVASGYVWFFRGTPVLVQLIFWYNIGIIFPRLGITVPFTSWSFFTVDANTVVTPLNAAILGLGLNSGAYIAEIVRSGIISVNRGQVEAAYALGLEPGRTMRRIVLPQAVPVLIPPLGNEFVSMLKYSALASVIAVQELLGSVENIYATNLRTLELLIVASLWYLALTTLFSFGQSRLEKRMAHGRSTAADRRREKAESHAGGSRG